MRDFEWFRKEREKWTPNEFYMVVHRTGVENNNNNKSSTKGLLNGHLHHVKENEKMYRLFVTKTQRNRILVTFE